MARKTKRLLKDQNLELRLRKLQETPIEFMDSPQFRSPKAEAEILGPAPPATGKKGRLRPPPGLPAYLASLYEVPLLTPQEEVYYFRKMNYLKYRAAQLRDRLESKRTVTAADLDRIEELLREAGEIKNRLVRANLRLVVSIAKKFARAGSNFFELVSDGNVPLMRAIERFDYTRGFKFSTYATWAIRRNFMRTIPTELTHMGRFRTGQDELFQHRRDQRTSPTAELAAYERQREAVRSLLDHLEEREQNILALRYGLNEGTEPLTLGEIGDQLGVTKERIRQLEARALRRLRQVAEEGKIDMPEA